LQNKLSGFAHKIEDAKKVRESMKRLPHLDWNKRKKSVLDFDPTLKQFRKFLLNEGYRQATIEGYVNKVRMYLKHTKSIKPNLEEAFRFRDFLIQTNKKSSTINNYCYAVRLFHKMNGERIKFPLLRRCNQIPYFFSEEDILKILDCL
jgi:hypothetical protein